MWGDIGVGGVKGAWFGLQYLKDFQVPAMEGGIWIIIIGSSSVIIPRRLSLSLKVYAQRDPRLFPLTGSVTKKYNPVASAEKKKCEKKLGKKRNKKKI
jgi:hypothetical protein